MEDNIKEYEAVFFDGNEACHEPKIEGKVFTNGERIRNMDDKKLADWIADILFYHAEMERDYGNDCSAECPLYECCNSQPTDSIEEWLQLPADRGSSK